MMEKLILCLSYIVVIVYAVMSFISDSPNQDISAFEVFVMATLIDILFTLKRKL